MGVAHGCVGDQEMLLLADPRGELRGAEFLELRARAGWRRGEAVVVGERGRLTPRCGRPPLHERVAVDDHVGEVLEHPRRPVAADRKVEEGGRLVDEPRRAVAGEEVRIRDEVDEERDVGLHPANAKLLQAALDVTGRLLMRQAAGCDFHEQRVEVGRDDGAREGGAGVEANAHAAGRPVGRHAAVVGEESVFGILGGDAALDRRPHRANRLLVAEADLRVGELVALGDEQLPPHDVDAGDLLGDSVLHLNPGVHLDEVETARVGIDEKLDGARVLIAGSAADGERRLADRVARGGVEVWGGGELDNLLMPPLHGAVAFEEMHEVAVQVAQQLHLDVPSPLDELLDEHRRGAEGRLAFALRTFERDGEFVLAADHPHAAAAAAVRRLEDHRPAEFLGNLQGVGVADNGLGAAGEDRHARLMGEVAGGGLVAERLQQLHPRADERDAGLGAGGRKLGVLREEAVAGVDAVHAVGLGQGDDAVDVEVGADRLPGLAHQIGLVSLEAVQCEAILVGVDRDGADAEFVRRPEHADRDFAAIGDEEFGDGPHGL